MQGPLENGFLGSLQRWLLCQALEAESDATALKFRAHNYQHRGELDVLEQMGWLRREGRRFMVSGAVLPFLETPAATKLLAGIEPVYKSLRERYFEDQDKEVPVRELAAKLAMSIDHVVSALELLNDVSGRSLGNRRRNWRCDC